MKSEELLYGVSHVGEDLLAAADQTVLAKKRRPRLGAAIAAVLVLTIGVGSFLLARKHLSGNAGTTDGSGPVLSGGETDVTRDPALPMLSVGQNWEEPSEQFTKVSSLLPAPEPRWSRTAEQGGTLPVYRNLNYAAAEYDAASGETLTRRLDELAALIGVTVKEGSVQFFHAGLQNGSTAYYTDDGNAADPDESGVWAENDQGVMVPYYYGAMAETDQGCLTVCCDGAFSLVYDQTHRFTPDPAELGVDPADSPFLVGSACTAYCRAFQTHLGFLDGLDPDASDACLELVEVDYDPLSSAYSSYVLAPARDDRVQSLLSAQFERVHLLTVDGQTLCGFIFSAAPTADYFDPTADCAAPRGYEAQGDYPIITLREARETLLSQAFLCRGDAFTIPNADAIEAYELVYLTGSPHELLLPFYRFWIRAQTDGGAALRAAYVPAVSPLYLTDWPRWQQNAALPVLSLREQSFPAEPLVLSGSAPDYLDSTPWQEEQRINTLPVYRNNSLGSDGKTLPVSVSALTSRANLIARCLGLELGPTLRYLDENGDPAVGNEACALVTESSLGTLKLFSDGSVEFRYKAEIPFCDPAETGDDARLLALAQLNDPAAVLRTDQLRFVRGLPMPADEGSVEAFPKLGSITGYSFERVQLQYRNGALTGFRLPGPFLPYSRLLPLSYAGTYVDYYASDVIDETPMVLSEQGWYPIITAQEARVLASAGGWYSGCKLEADPVSDPDWDEDVWLGSMDLVYLPVESNRLLLPYYRFLYPLGTDDQGRSLYAQRFVPAINGMFLEDYSSDPDLVRTRGNYSSALSGMLGNPDVREAFYALLADPERLYAAWQGGETEQYPRFGITLPVAASAKGEWYWKDASGEAGPEQAVRRLTALLLEELKTNPWGLESSYTLEDYHIHDSTFCGSETVPELGDHAWLVKPVFTLKYDGVYGLTSFEDCVANGNLDEDGYAYPYDRGRLGDFLYVLTEHDGVWRMELLSELTKRAVSNRPLSELAADAVDPSADPGAGIRVLWQDSERVIFCGSFGVLGCNWHSQEPIFHVDALRAVGAPLSLQGDERPCAVARVSEDGSKLCLGCLLGWAEETRYVDCCLIDLKAESYQWRSVWPGEIDWAEPVSEDDLPWGWDSAVLYDLWLRHDGEKWYPFRNVPAPTPAPDPQTEAHGDTVELELYLREYPVDTPEDLEQTGWAPYLGVTVTVENAEGETLVLNSRAEGYKTGGEMELLNSSDVEGTENVVFTVPWSESFSFSTDRQDRSVICSVRWDDLQVTGCADSLGGLYVSPERVELISRGDRTDCYYVNFFLNESLLIVSGERSATVTLERSGNRVKLRSDARCQVSLLQNYKRKQPNSLLNEILAPGKELSVDIPQN